jgi:hypothetical protein
MPVSRFEVDFHNESVSRQVEALGSKDGRHHLLTTDDGLSLYVLIQDGRVKAFEHVDSAGNPAETLYLKVSPHAGPEPQCMVCTPGRGGGGGTVAARRSSPEPEPDVVWACIRVPCKTLPVA